MDVFRGESNAAWQDALSILVMVIKYNISFIVDQLWLHCMYAPV